MVNITLSIPDELQGELRKYDEVNWSAVIRKLLVEHLERIKMVEKIAQKSKLTEKDAKEIADKIDKSVAKKLGLYEKK
ncbi:MAG: hypothetical protein AABW80_01040 [Nanoarchaeota archaeon]